MGDYKLIGSFVARRKLVKNIYKSGLTYTKYMQEELAIMRNQEAVTQSM